MTLTSTLDKIISYSAQVAEPELIILFGSMINGNANVYSDVDLLIITSNNIDKKEVVAKIKNHASQNSIKTDVLIYSALELEKELKIPASFVAAIYEHGRVVYKKKMIKYFGKF